MAGALRMQRTAELKLNLAKVRQRVDDATEAANRPQGSVQLLPVTKFHPTSDLEILRELGVKAVGENRDQEARAKIAAVPALHFHMIGQIQTKKANSVVRWAAMVHTVDSQRLAHALDKGVGLAIERGQRHVEKLPCLVQLSLDEDPQRGGVAEKDILSLARTIEQAAHLSFSGLMCVLPVEWSPERGFAQAQKVLEMLEDSFGRNLEFSAGMSGDLVEAIMYGSTIVRVGTEILGPRPLA